MDSAHLTAWISEEVEQAAKKKARERTATERWNRDSTVFAYSILIIVLILLNNEVEIRIVAAVAILGLMLIWVMGWLQGRQLFKQIYDEEIVRLQQEVKIMAGETEGETIEEKIRKAMRNMWR